MVNASKTFKLLVTLLLFLPAVADAYEVDIQLVQPATGTYGLWATESAQMGKHLGYRAAMHLQYARDPLVLSLAQIFVVRLIRLR